MIAGTVELIERGMQCFVQGLGDIEAEQFIAAVKRERFDYTEWQRNYFDGMNPDDFNSSAAEYDINHPLT
ncbi:MAG: hypothetical protein II877_07145 [Synergistaceae bacterium]|nr:hypothetical protein [Synergistaceae bacterium]MBQ7170415.1 hypothetical protein [Synergistaceae bacterium]